MTADRPPDPLSLFWAPVCAVGSHGSNGPNAMISVSVFGASIVPEKPRLIAGIFKTNYTEELVRASGSLAISVLAEHQVELLSVLGLRSGRDRSKLSGLDYELTEAGDPYFPDASALVDCRVIDGLDGGDATFFLCRVHDRRWLSDKAPLDRFAAMQSAGPEFHRVWSQKQAREQEASRATMRW
ncbi:MAG: flavin reductase family protein [Dehalococcoidia bacterium]